MQDNIVIKGAREHNLRDIDLSIPRGKLVVVTGPSGSGKSSLAIDTIYAEGQRRYVESLSVYARQFLGEMQKPDVDSIEGLSPAIAIEQKTISKSPRSTVGTLTELYDYLRVLYTRIGKPYCHQCAIPLISQDTESLLTVIRTLATGTKLQILSPIAQQRKGTFKKELLAIRGDGYVRARIDGEMVDLTEDINLNKNKRHTIEIVIDRLVIKSGVERKLKEAVNAAMRFSSVVIINLIEEDRDILLSKTMICPKCGNSVPDLTPMYFSFNSNLGACPRCKGIGFENLGEDDSDTPGILTPCQGCHGLRLNKEALSIRINDLNIGELSLLSIADAHEFLRTLPLSERDAFIASRILRELTDRLSFLERVGLDYLALNRLVATLSGGEAQRMRLATQLGSNLSGVLYVLDEPSIGLHPSDCSKLLDSLREIKDAGNTVIVIEHDEETIRFSDVIIDMGPEAGVRGGLVVAMGTPEEIAADAKSPTGRFLSGASAIGVPERRRTAKGHIVIAGASENNLKDITVSLPLGVFVCVTGVSGSGKSTLVIDTLYPALMNSLYGSGLAVGRHEAISGIDAINKCISVDQSPIGKTPRSNPSTYAGMFTYIRELFANTMQARSRGYTTSRFSFNITGGRCEDCKGAGIKKYEMHFLPDAYVQCEVCGGSRFNRETLEVVYKGKTIAEVLAMSVSEAREFFLPITPLRQTLSLLEEVGLGYIHLGQAAGTLSGGEAQRLKLTRELAKRSSGNTIYLLDEPTTGLHFVDIDRLLQIIHRLVDMGNTVIVIEHNLDIIKSADYIIDLGPAGGNEGGYVIAVGTPEEIVANSTSLTGRFLRVKL
ncbi:MAG: excinuclease ABC subunit UvrA [Nitrospirae bacterium]|uniref:excinuclease ABC subunit UvrA n=1 Tax=Candidatus Magnetobacterium casense TaxID=1455061 RepID=UPI00058CEF20|nr:excinuclease ABC subunit UvrA [Nitrospirota bacterium]